MTIAATRSGKIEGVEIDGVHVFRGIPYAAPPVGDRRWKAPQREESWDGVRDALAFSAQSAQTEFQLLKLMGGERPEYSEDSLYLNVWTPACDDGRRPVMVWIHGGAFIWGAGDTPWYDGTHFVQHGDMVVVTINYRLGPFGFLHLADLFGDEYAGSGNAAILDQVAALEWVRDCIAGFGGDPERVTIFGESAGGASVSTLLGTPAARGLFSGAIPQSGGASWIGTPAAGTAVAQGLIDRLGVRASDTAALLAKSTDEILAAQPAFTENGVNSLPFQPVHDGTVLPVPPLEAIANGNATGVRVLTGTNAQEMTLFSLADPTLGGLDDAGLLKRLQPVFGAGAEAVLAGYRATRPDANRAELWIDISTDAVFRIPAARVLEAQQGHAPVWSYLFTWESPVFGGVLRSAHALEIPFVFDNLERGTDLLTGTGADRQPLADAMHQAWIAFARTGDPNHPGLPAWPEYDLDRRATMRFDQTFEVLDDPGRAERILISERFPG